MEDKLIKENDTNVWRETKHGLGYVYPKNAFWIFLEKEEEENLKIENEFTRQYAETLRKIYGKINDNDTPKDQEASKSS